MSSVPYWIGPAATRGDSAWNHCILGDIDLPGIITVTVERSRKIDVQNPKGEDGAYVVDEGNDPAKVSIEVLLATEVAWESWQIEYPNLDGKTHGKKREPMEILHPECRIMGVRAVYIQRIQGLPPSARGGKRYSIECIEYLPKPVKPKKKAVKSAPIRTAKSAGGMQYLSNRDQAFQPTGADALDRIMGDNFSGPVITDLGPGF